MFFHAWLQRRREAHTRVQRDATDLLTFLGDLGYPEARDRARRCREKKDRAGERHWGRVALEIADKTDILVGETVPDRYEAARAEPPRVDSKRRLIATHLTDLSATLSAIARGRANAATLHNVEVHVRRIVGLGGATPAMEKKGRAVTEALRRCSKRSNRCGQALRPVFICPWSRPPRPHCSGYAEPCCHQADRRRGAAILEGAHLAPALPF